MEHPSHDTSLILLPGLRPPVPPRPERLGKRRPAAGLARLGRTGDVALAVGLAVAAVVIVAATSVPVAIAAVLFLCGQLALRPRRTAVEVPSV